MSIMYTASDAAYAGPELKYRQLLVTLDHGLGSEECRKLCFLAVDLGMSKSQTERVKQAIDIFDELEQRMFISANDVSLLMEMMSLIHRRDLMIKIQSVYNNSSLTRSIHSGHLSQFRLLLLEIADNTTSSDLQAMKHACKDILGRQVMSKLKDAIQLFLLFEERGMLASTNMDFLKQLLKLCGNMSMLEKVNKFIMTMNETPKVPTDMEIMKLSSHLGAEWKMLGTYLGLSSHQLETINCDFRMTQDKIVAMLTAWRESSGKDAYQTLSKALKSCRRMDLARDVDALASHKASVPAASTVVLPHHVTSQPLQPEPVYQLQHLSTQLSQTSLMVPADFQLNPLRTPPVHTGLPDTTQHGYQTDPPDSVLENVSSRIAADWRMVGKILQIDDNTMKWINSSDQHSAEKALEMLKTWRNKLPLHADGTTILASVLKVSGLLDLSEQLKGTQPAANTLTAQMQEMETSIPSESTNQDETSMENLVVLSEGTREEAYQQASDGKYLGTADRTSANLHTKLHQESFPEYRMNRNPRGLCMIINNKHFHGKKKLSERKGSEKDAGKLHNLFDKLHFKVELREDMAADEMYAWFMEVSQMDHSQYDCFVCCIMSHGELGAIHGSDGHIIEIQDILALFKSIACKSLNNKPKLFFIQACQGTVHQEGIQTDEPRGIGTGTGKTLPKEADFLLSYATVPGYVSYRSITEGSWYVNALVDQINRYHNELDLIGILAQVNYYMSESVANVKEGYMKQVAAPSFTLRKQVNLRSLQP